MSFLRWLGWRRFRYNAVLPVRLRQSTLKSNIESETIELRSSDEGFSSQLNRTKKRSWDWRSNVKLALVISMITLVANSILLIVGISVEGNDGGIGTLHRGSAVEIARLSTGYHVLINILSTGLLTSSNYCMQLVYAPTRDDIVILHDRGGYYDIGILSFRNVRHIPRRRAILWFMLAASSIPLHLFYNSSVFSVTVGRDYEINFVNGSDTNMINNLDFEYASLKNSDWMNIYDTKYITDYGSLYLVLDEVSFEMSFDTKNWTWKLQDPTSDINFAWNEIKPLTSDASMWTTNLTMRLSNPNGTSGHLQQVLSTRDRLRFPISDYSSRSMPSTKWPKASLFNISKHSSWKDLVSLNPDAWLYPPWHVGYGIAEVIRKGSAVQIWSAFIGVVLFCNAVKTLSIYYTLKGSYSSQIITQGDAISSFLKTPDLSTAGFCIADKRLLVRNLRLGKSPEALVWEYKKRYYLDRARGRWISYFMIGTVFAISAVGIIIISVQPLSKWGTASTNRLPINVSPLDARGIIVTSWLANSPQLLLSVFYLAANRICTSLCFVREWNDHAISRKALRVTHTEGEDQRSAYFLQLPYRWAFPLTAMSGVLHWLLSQTLFLVRVESYDEHKTLNLGASTCTCGYSSLSFLVFLICFFAMTAVILVLMSRSITYSIPPADHCSLVISAACHPPPEETDSHLKLVQWGAIPNLFGGTIDHCSFSSADIQPLKAGTLYA